MRLLSGMSACVLVWGLVASAAAQWGPEQQGPQGQPPQAQQAPDEPECFPACREGFVCHQGECISQCNPPCGPGQRCEGGQQCVAAEQAAPGQYGAGGGQGQPGGYAPPPQGQQGGGPAVVSQDEAAWASGAGSEEPRGKNAPRFLMGFHLGAAGDLENAPAPGAFLRFDFPFFDYFALSAPNFMFGAVDSNRNFYFDIGIMPRGRFPIPLGAGHIDVYIGVPVGFTAFVFKEGFVDFEEYGYHVGVLAGAQFFFGASIGLTVELGYLRESIESVDFGTGADSSFGHMALNIGFALLMGR